MSERIYVGSRKGLFTLARGKGGWDVEALDFLAEPVSAILPQDDGTLTVALDLGHFGNKFWRRKPGGAWEERPVPAFPAKPEDAADDPHPWSVGKVWAFADGGVKRRIWAGAIPAGLFRSDDGGDSWTLIRALWDIPERRQWQGGGTDQPGLHSILVDPRDPEHVVVAVSSGGAWTTRDGGKSWTVTSKGMYAEYMPPERREDPIAQDPHLLAQCAAKPDVMWCQHHNGTFRSTDGGMTWAEITAIAPSKFGFAVAAHPTDPQTAWFVPAVKDEKRVPVDGKVVVARTRDGGRSFDVLRAGLPQRHAYDLVWRHALDVDATGQRLAFGSTSGGLWTSENGGDSWTALDARLPPISVIRYARA